MREIPADTVARALVVVDQREACMAEAGDLLIPLSQGVISQEQLTTELGEVVSGEKAGRTLNEQITLFKSVGVAVQDVAAAAVILQAAERLDLGTVVNL
jgi:ornithine cyclodeaminase/alanine dehydrogenase-like protein (mu-crystallin family)